MSPLPAATVPEPFSEWPARAVQEHFATRPTLMSVLAKALKQRLLERYPTLDIDLFRVKLARPYPSGGWTFELLLQIAIEQLLNPTPPNFTPRDDREFFLTQNPPMRLKPLSSPRIDMQVVARLIAELPATLSIDYQQALADYWNQTDNDGTNRWQWLGNFLHSQFKVMALRRPDMNEEQQQMLSEVAAWPDRIERMPRAAGTVYAWFMETTLGHGERETRRLGAEILLARGSNVLLCHVDGRVEAFKSLDEFGERWSQRMRETFLFERLSWKRYEPDGNLFELQASLILNSQLDDLAAFRADHASDREDLDRRLSLLTDPSTRFLVGPQPVQPSLAVLDSQLPDWLKGASSTDRFAYRMHLLDLAAVAAKSEGRTFNEGLEDIRTFSRNALRTQMKLDNGQSAVFDPDDLELDFAVAAGYPGGAGFVEHVRMFLTDLALKNLAGKPNGRMTISHKQGQVLPQWLNEEYLLGSSGLIQRADIGRTYPQKIRDLLLADNADAIRREVLFTRQLRVQLPMRALEYKIRGVFGLSAKGYRYVSALMGATRADRRVDDQDIVLRPLAFHRKPGAEPDVVEDMFLIEPKDLNTGPHILYRPQYKDPLLEYPTRQALFNALAEPGDLQESVLIWLKDRARPIYANGGFKEPHIVHFHADDEFSLLRKPDPVTIAGDEGAQALLQSLDDGVILSQLYDRNARALVDLAERQSVSNSESRWAVMLQGAGLLFNTLLLPLLRGPLMLAGWMLVLINSLETDLTALDSDDPRTRELALIDLLLNTAMVLMHALPTPTTPRSPLSRPAPDETALPLAAWRRGPHQADLSTVAPLSHGTKALPGEPIGSGQTPLDFISSTASPKSTEKLLDTLLGFNVPWPEKLPDAETNGPYKGLYRIGNLWHATTGGLLFQVSIVPGFGDVYIVDPVRPDHPGFKLTSDNQGHWRLDRGLKLEGGGPKSRRTAKLKELQRQLDDININKPTLVEQANRQTEQTSKAREALFQTVDEFHSAEKALGNARNALQTARPGERQAIETQHARVIKAFADIKRTGDIQCELLTKLTDRLSLTVDSLIEISRKSEPLDPITDHRRTRADLLARIGVGYVSAINYSIEVETPAVTPRGEPVEWLIDRAEDELDEGNPLAYLEKVEVNEARLEIMERTTRLTTRLERIYEQMNESPAGQAERRRLVELSTRSHVRDRLSAVVMSLDVNRLLTMDQSIAPHEVQERFYELTIRETLLSHMGAKYTAGFTSAERQAALLTVIDQYKHSINLCQQMLDQGLSPTRIDYQRRYISNLGEVLENAEAELAELIRAEADIPAEPLIRQPQREPSATKRVFKTRNKGTLVGDAIPAPAGQSGDFIEIRKPGATEAIATYHRHPDENVYVEQVIAPPHALDRPSPSRSLSAITRESSTLLNTRADIESSIHFQQKKLNDPTRLENLDPLDWDNMLARLATKLEVLASEAGRRQDPASAEFGKKLRGEIADITRAAREHCAEGYKKQLPEAQKIDYLWRHGFVDINLVKRLKKLATGDYLTEYSIREKNSPNVLWYAHFHYPTLDTPRADYAYAHLKVPAQRYLTYKDLLQQAAADNRTVVNLKKAVITSPLDEKLFLKL